MKRDTIKTGIVVSSKVLQKFKKQSKQIIQQILPLVFSITDSGKHLIVKIGLQRHYLKIFCTTQRTAEQ